MLDLISRQAAIDALLELDVSQRVSWLDAVIDMIDALPSAQPERRWETCFDCPLSHGCPKIKGCTNEQAEQYASEIPKGCPLSAQPEWGLPVDVDRPLADKEIVSRLRDIQKQIGGSYAIDRAIEVIEAVAEQSTQSEQRWIPCNERLPKEGQKILATVVDNSFVDVYIIRGYYKKMHKSVISWMPLPEPWKGESNANNNSQN